MFWIGRRVFITGHTGFKGSWLALWLRALGAQVTGYSIGIPSQPNLFETAGAGQGIESVYGDVRDFSALTSAIERSRPEVLFHLAAQSLVRESYRDPLNTYSTNVMGTVNVLQCARNAPSLQAVLVVTSDKCYENRGGLWGFRETDPIGGADPYSSSKGCAELVTAAYRNSFFGTGVAAKSVAVASARAGNVIGGGDWACDRLVPDAVRAFSNGKKLLIRNPDHVRPWQHVLDPLAGYLTLAEGLLTRGEAFAGGWNFGPDAVEVKSVREVVNAIAILWGEGAAFEQANGEGVPETEVLRLDATKARITLGWSPRLDTGQCLKWAMEWYKAFHRQADMRRYTLGQIEAFEALGNPRHLTAARI